MLSIHLVGERERANLVVRLATNFLYNVVTSNTYITSITSITYITSNTYITSITGITYITRNTYITSNTYIPSVFVTPPTTCHASAEPSASSDKGSSTQGVLLPNFLIFNLLSSHHRLVLSVLLKHACQITFPITNPRL